MTAHDAGAARASTSRQNRIADEDAHDRLAGPATVLLLRIIATDMPIMVITIMMMIGMMIGADEQQQQHGGDDPPIRIMIGIAGTSTSSTSTTSSSSIAGSLKPQTRTHCQPHIP